MVNTMVKISYTHTQKKISYTVSSLVPKLLRKRMKIKEGRITKIFGHRVKMIVG